MVVIEEKLKIKEFWSLSCLYKLSDITNIDQFRYCCYGKGKNKTSLRKNDLTQKSSKSSVILPGHRIQKGFSNDLRI